mmetsp:Transcript_63931/g.114089  ORF Transcript_63931/g.114089 Transcript_63931/m.114089 type:complete len:388 (+) Transcript_63931:89-1252(+)
MVMHKIGLMLACLSCGKASQSSTDLQVGNWMDITPSSQPLSDRDMSMEHMKFCALHMFAKLLVRLNPAAAFRPSASGMHNPTLVNSRPRRSGRSASMAQPTVSQARDVGRIKKSKGLLVTRALRATHSKRDVERLISEGRLLVNGKPTTIGRTLRKGNKVTLDGKPVAWTEEELGPHRYLKFNKPVGVVCTTDPSIEENILNTLTGLGVPEEGRRIFPVGRLDANSTGIILLTSNGDIGNQLLEPQEGKTKEYHVRTNVSASEKQAQKLSAGVHITTLVKRREGMEPYTAQTLPCVVRCDGEGGLIFMLEEGRNRQIRHMCEAVGLEVVSLHRATFAGVSLEGCESPGDWAYLTPEEELIVGAKTRQDVRTPKEQAMRKLKKIMKKR